MSSRVEDSDWELLRKAAEQARERAYSPYSDYAVGAAVLTSTGDIFSGCNVENASYGLTICAERNAIFAAVSGSSEKPHIVALYVDADPPAAPCGACRQVIVEFGPTAQVSFPRESDRPVTPIVELLPESFEFPA